MLGITQQWTSIPPKDFFIQLLIPGWEIGPEISSLRISLFLARDVAAAHDVKCIALRFLSIQFVSLQTCAFFPVQYIESTSPHPTLTVLLGLVNVQFHMQVSSCFLPASLILLLACKTGVIFLRILGDKRQKRGKCEAQVECEEKSA